MNTYLKNIVIRWNFLGWWLDTLKDIKTKCYWININNRMPTKKEIEILYTFLKTYRRKPLVINIKKKDT